MPTIQPRRCYETRGGDHACICGVAKSFLTDPDVSYGLVMWSLQGNWYWTDSGEFVGVPRQVTAPKGTPLLTRVAGHNAIVREVPACRDFSFLDSYNTQRR